MRVLHHIKKLDDCFGIFDVRVTCRHCGKVREFSNEAMVRLAGSRSSTFAELEHRLSCESCHQKCTTVIAVAKPRPRGLTKNPR